MTTKLGFWLLLAASPAASAAQDSGACLNLTAQPRVSLSGRLVERVFPGSPNFQSIAKGDARERAFILELPASRCADDGENITPKDRFRTVHLMPAEGQPEAPLRAALGKQVMVYGEALGAHTGHHHAPLVMLVERVRVTGGRGPAATTPRRGGRPHRG